MNLYSHKLLFVLWKKNFMYIEIFKNYFWEFLMYIYYFLLSFYKKEYVFERRHN